MKQSTKIRIPSIRALVLQRHSSVVLSAVLCLLAACPEIEEEGDTAPSPVSTAGRGGKSGGMIAGAGGAGGAGGTGGAGGVGGTGGAGGADTSNLPKPQPPTQPRLPDPPPAPKDELTCGECLEQKCDTQWTACQNNTTCADLIDCRIACPDGDRSCLDGCDEEFAGGTALLNAFGECGTSMCPVCLDDPPPPDTEDDPDNACTVSNPREWTEPPVWTETELQACLDECETDMCVEETCDDGERFLDCFRRTKTKCAGDPGGACRRQYEAFSCCIDICDEESADDAEFEACIDRDCPTERDAWVDCRSDADCAAPVRAACIMGPL